MEGEVEVFLRLLSFTLLIIARGKETLVARKRPACTQVARDRCRNLSVQEVVFAL